ncbi:MAG TPA: Spy/CpxP family protein refolding chaperone, partial [Caulobacteraceae bacterium]|nr:Spy/CpxP family protein refolding chaperone [Caulobacteraceae bacterium]
QALTTPERLDKMAARMDERRARFNRVAAATKQFYAQLTPAQQKAFDSLRLGHEHGGGGGRWGHGPHGGMGGHEMGPGDQPHG